MKAEISINLDNAAFDADYLPIELSRCLSDLAKRISEQSREYLLNYDNKMRVSDSNGNTVGFLRVVGIEE